MNWNKNQVIAHRGAFRKNNFPENSIASLKEAIRLKCYGSEFDVHLTKDKIIVVNHDDDFLGMPIALTAYSELMQKTLHNGEHLPTLENYLQEGIKQDHTKMILEIKIAPSLQETLELTDAVLNLVKKLNAGEWIEYISFSYEALLRVLQIDPEAKTAFLAEVNDEKSLEKLKSDRITQADYDYTIYQTGNWFNQARQQEITLNAWTVDQESDMKKLLANHIDFITTNEPELLFDLLRNS
ncbi:glycerophosphodiester phosphodiesterase [Pedobacter cryoconitis]|uniref:Glycerophosphoryl diester phosphodiesterase n=1 Tax=Pedobacter cryoconitis TaxID=188932 RepID=A0A7X0IZ81_9SPHI|nr:glycerophosphodiester phosphodiesterase family protein [Pedobacter cryoconitis]MBB6498088.1 glycerophosphoryl diester phosphodiesterase [Pedobacter cryoconitis]